MKTTRQSKMVVLVLAILAIFLIPSPVLTWADDVYVDCRNTAGPWDGSIDHPYRTIQNAIDAATTYDGDTLRVADCIYEEGIVVNKFLKILGSGPDVTTLDITGVAGEDIAVEIQENMIATICGFRIISPKEAIVVRRYAKLVICNNIITGGNGVYTSDNTCGVNVDIYNNTIDSCTGTGVRLDGCSGGTISAKIYNNIITKNAGNGIHKLDWVSLANSYNNVWANGTNYRGCSAGTGCISENPLYIDAPTGNYRLQPTSPCIDAGWPIKTELDPDGTRNNMGAYGGPGSADFWPDSPGAPVVTDLTVTPAAVPTDGTVTIKATGRVRPYSPGQE
jgi:hypothetical protein